MYIDLIYRLVNRREKEGSQTLIKFFKVKWIVKLKFHLSSIQLYNEFGTTMFSAGHALTIHNRFCTIYCCSSVVYHNFVSSTVSCSKVSFKLCWSTVNVRLCITSVKSAAISLTWDQAVFFLFLCFFGSRHKGIIGRGHDLRLPSHPFLYFPRCGHHLMSCKTA